MIRTLLAAGLLAAATFIQAATSATPAGRVFDAWLAAYNSADAARIAAFNETHRGGPRPVEQTLASRALSGGFDVLRIERSEPRLLTALLQERGSDTVGRIELNLSADDPPKVLDISLRRVPRPAEFALPRLPQTEAVRALATRADQLVSSDRFAGALNRPVF